MKRLSKIDESTWGDMVKRAEGDAIRKEDDVNLLDFDGLYAYVNKKYKDDVYKIKKGKLMGGDGQYCELFPIDENMWISIFYKTPYEIRNISIMWNDTVRESFIDKLRERFKTQDFFLSQYVEIQEKDSTVSNQTYIDLIDFVLSCSVKDVFITESTWGDMARRAEGEQIRREDDVNLMDMEGFIDYITSHYRFKQGHSYVTINDMSILSIPMFKGVNVTYDDQANWVTASPSLVDGLRQLFYKLKEEYIVTYKKEQKSKITFNVYIQIEPKKGEVTKKFYLDVLDFIIDNNPYDDDAIYIERI